MRGQGQAAAPAVTTAGTKGASGAGVVVIGLIALIGGVVVFMVLASSEEAPTEPSTASSKPAIVEEISEPAPAPEPEPEPEVTEPEQVIEDEVDIEPLPPEPEPEPEPIRAEAYQPLRGCGCKADFDGDGKKEKVQLAVKVSNAGTWLTGAGMQREYAFDFIVKSSTGEPWRLEVDSFTAPPKRKRGELMNLGVACEQDRMIFATGSKATSWSLREHAVEWKHDLPAPYAKKGARKPGPEVAIDCGKLPIKKGLVQVRLPGGTIELQTVDGNEAG